jgi:hypothetical protein
VSILDDGTKRSQIARVDERIYGATYINCPEPVHTIAQGNGKVQSPKLNKGVCPRHHIATCRNSSPYNVVSRQPSFCEWNYAKA